MWRSVPEEGVEVGVYRLSDKNFRSPSSLI